MELIEITDFGDARLDVFARLTEAQLRTVYEPVKEGLFIAESPNVIERALDAGYEPVSLLMERSHAFGAAAGVIARCPGVPVFVSDTAVLTELTGFQLTRGVLCAMRRRPLPSLSEVLRGAKRICVLEDVMNPTNVGAIFRSAAALGMDALLLTPGCSDPLYRRAARVSMGTVFQIPWTQIGETPADWPEKGLAYLKEEGFATASLALRDDTVSISDPALAAQEKLCLILGTEGDGLADETICRADFRVKIPMFHGVDSLNVAAASAVAFWELGEKAAL